mmetsp:Transcript_5522/g.8833  ORF Transcript_5522/g.8833 Transcript_5522/m.8833 type:complete len:437 (+) Transcript_5522:125-1435(+)
MNASASMIPPPTPASQRGLSAGGGAKSGIKPSIGAHTLCSFGKGTNENQDSFVTSANGSKFLVGVFDGHGEKGKIMSEFARSAMSKSLFAHKGLHSDPKQALESAYRDTQSQIEQVHGMDASMSGTTAVAAFQHRDRLLVANVGDSRAVLGRCDTARKGMRAVELTSDQKPSRADEKQRILAAGGKVDQLAFPVWHPQGGFRLMRGGPERVMDSSGFGGLAMSRSLGDLSLRPYVSSQPEMVERKLDNKDKFLVLGSDGVWDQVSSQEAIDIAGKRDDPIAAAREITGVARRRWQSETDGQLSDDITAVVVKLDHEAGGMMTPAASSRVDTASLRRNSNSLQAAERSLSSPARRHQQQRQPGFDRPDLLSPTRPPRSSASEGNRRGGSLLGHSKSDTNLGNGGRRPATGGRRESAPIFATRPELLPPAGRRSRHEH